MNFQKNKLDFATLKHSLAQQPQQLTPPQLIKSLVKPLDIDPVEDVVDYLDLVGYMR